MAERVTIYAQGLVCSSVCADGDMTPEEVEQAVNEQSPTGISSRWTISKEPFKDGTPNPHPCEVISTRKHYLLEC